MLPLLTVAYEAVTQCCQYYDFYVINRKIFQTYFMFTLTLIGCSGTFYFLLLSMPNFIFISESLNEYETYLNIKPKKEEKEPIKMEKIFKQKNVHYFWYKRFYFRKNL
uniref:Uncharacterized protein n=1 Tax=Panagrolaimus sp. PS1159 TaxID=55785 RepID=A0AC35FX27_9BILA